MVHAQKKLHGPLKFSADSRVQWKKHLYGNKKDGKTIATGRSLCLMAAVTCGICSAYWLAQSVLYGNVNLPAILAAALLGLYHLRSWREH